MNQPHLSRIVTVYDQWGFLDWLDDDALFTPETEFILVDDCSKQAAPPDLLSRMKARGVRLHRLLRNSGRCVARNTGAQLAGGEFLDFIDGDDRPLPLAADPAWASADVVFFHFDVHGMATDMRRSWVRHPLLAAADSPEGYLDPRPAAVLWRKTAFASLGGFDARFETGEDLELVLRALDRPRAFSTKPKQSYNEQPRPDYTEMLHVVIRLALNRRLPADQPLRQGLLDEEVRRLSLLATWNLLRRGHHGFLFRSCLALLWNLAKTKMGLLKSPD